MKEDGGKMKSTNKKTRNSRTPVSRRNGISDNPLQKQITPHYEDQHLNRNDLQRFQQFAFVNYFKSITEAIKNLYGRHNTIEYKQEYGFKEQWERSKKISITKDGKGNFGQAIYLIFMTCALTLSLWSLSMSLVFNWDSCVWIYCLIFILNSLLILNKWDSTRQQRFPSTFQQKIRLFMKQISCLMFCIFCLSKRPSELRGLQILWGIVIFVLLYMKSSSHYKKLKIFYISSDYQDFVNLFDLFTMLITITHIFALALFSITGANPQSNWITGLDLSDPDWTIYYIYSLYFSCTTLLTVGYGDISPTNPHEIVVILITQLIGIATFAYTVNQIGAALSSMQQKKQKMQKDLNNVETLGNTYRLDPNILCRMRTELMNTKVVSDDMRVEEEKELLLKFSDDLRQQIKVESCIKVIKRSADILANWSGRFQSKIASKLVKNIYTTQEPLVQIPGKQQIYIIDQGRVDIINNFRSGHKICFQKVLKTINIVKDSEILVGNVFGYSYILAEKPLRLTAICKSTSICYSLSKNDFLECLSECQEDLEHYYRLKSEMNLLQIPEYLEVPAIRNIREHYIPLESHIIGRYKKIEGSNFRRRRTRPLKKNALRIFQINPDFLECINGSLQKSLTIKKSQNSDEISSRSDEKEEDEEGQPEDPTMEFQTKKEYKRYFKDRNCETVLKKFQSHNFQCSKQKKRMF